MQQNRHTCVALYLEEEYKALALEAHFDCKRPDIPVGNRPSFQCKFCKQCFKDKNTLSHHRMMTQCPEYKGKDLLKMYPTWTKSEAKEWTRLGEKYGKTLPNRFKQPSEQEPVYPTKRVAPTKQQGEATSMPPQRPKLLRRRRFTTSVAMKTFHQLQIKVQAICLFCLILQFLGRNLLAQLRRPWRSLQRTRPHKAEQM
jgi:hypothetical protein